MIPLLHLLFHQIDISESRYLPCRTFPATAPVRRGPCGAVWPLIHHVPRRKTACQDDVYYTVHPVAIDRIRDARIGSRWIVVSVILIWLWLAGLPGRIAISRKHPEAEAVKLLGYVGLLQTICPWMRKIGIRACSSSNWLYPFAG